MMTRRGLLALPAALAACAAPPPPPPPPPVLELTIAAGADQNPDQSGHPAPVAVRLYQLAATGRFERADVFALTEREAQTLAEQSLGSEELILRPGETRTVTRELKPGVQFLGVAVLFRHRPGDVARGKPGGAAWADAPDVENGGEHRNARGILIGVLGLARVALRGRPWGERPKTP